MNEEPGLEGDRQLVHETYLSISTPLTSQKHNAEPAAFPLPALTPRSASPASNDVDETGDSSSIPGLEEDLPPTTPTASFLTPAKRSDSVVIPARGSPVTIADGTPAKTAYPRTRDMPTASHDTPC